MDSLLTAKEQLDLVLDNLVPNHPLAERYLSRRGVKMPKGWGYISYLFIDALKGAVSSSIVLLIKDLEGEVIGCELRSVSEEAEHRYSKILTDDIQLYNVANKNFNSKVIITEGIIDCETIYQNVKGVNVVSGLRAKVPKKTLMFMAFMYTDIIIWFDADKAGREGAREVYNFFKKYHPTINVSIYKQKKYNDPNEMCMEDVKLFKKEVRKAYGKI